MNSYKVVCIEDSYSEGITENVVKLHAGKVYTVIQYYERINSLFLIDVEEDRRGVVVDKRYFIGLDEWRDRQIGDLLNEV